MGRPALRASCLPAQPRFAGLPACTCGTSQSLTGQGPGRPLAGAVVLAAACSPLEVAHLEHGVALSSTDSAWRAVGPEVRSRQLSQWRRPLLAVLVLLAALVVALKVPNMEFIFGLTGSTSIPLLAYFMPGCIYVHIACRDASFMRSNALMSRAQAREYAAHSLLPHSVRTGDMTPVGMVQSNVWTLQVSLQR